MWDAATPDEPIFERSGAPRDEPIQASLLTSRRVDGILVYADRAELVTLATGRVPAVPGDSVRSGDRQRDGRYLAAVALAGDPERARAAQRVAPTAVVTVHDLATGAPLPALSSSADVTSLAFAPTGHLLALGTDDGTEIWKLPEGQRLAGLVGQAASDRTAWPSTHGQAGLLGEPGRNGGALGRGGHQLDLPAPRPADRAGRSAAELLDLQIGPNGDAYYILSDRIVIRDGETGDMLDPIVLPDNPRSGVPSEPRPSSRSQGRPTAAASRSAPDGAAHGCSPATRGRSWASGRPATKTGARSSPSPSVLTANGWPSGSPTTPCNGPTAPSPHRARTCSCWTGARSSRTANRSRCGSRA